MLKRILCGATLLCVAGFSNAGIIVQSFTVDRQLTNFFQTISFNQFNDMGGTLILESVQFELFARSSGSVRAENLSNTRPSLVTATLSTDIRLLDSSDALLLEAAPSVTNTVSLGTFDGMIDFDGTSGQTFLGLETNDFASTILLDGPSLATYTGLGMETVKFDVTATSFVMGGGNLISGARTFASGDVVVTYIFEEVNRVVSSPTQVALLGLGLLALAGLRKTKK